MKSELALAAAVTLGASLVQGEGAQLLSRVSWIAGYGDAWIPILLLVILGVLGWAATAKRH